MPLALITSLAGATLQPQAKRVQALEGRIRTGPLQARSRHRAGGCASSPPRPQRSLDACDPHLPSSVATSVRESARRQASERVRVSEKADRATVEQALDPRTRLVLFKMLNQGVFSEINGCISTGKEANVYHASTAEGRHLAVKARRLATLRPAARRRAQQPRRCTRPLSSSSRTATDT